MRQLIRLFTLIFILLSTSSCKNGLGFLHKEIKGYGYIPYTTPLEFSGPGTLIGGAPSSMQIIASPETCFPEQIGEIKTDLRREDRTSLPKRNFKFTVTGDFKVNLLNFMQTGNATIQAGTNFSVVNSIELEMTGVHIEYMDSIRLTQYYNEQMPQICKDYLEKVGFIIQALKADKLIFKFMNKSGQRIFFRTQNLENIVDIDADISWEIQNNTELIINTPKYLGYQLASLRLNQDGMVLYRATQVRWKKYYFRPISIFKDSSAHAVNEGSEEIEETDSEFLLKPLNNKNQLDRFSHYLPLPYLEWEANGNK